MSMTPWRDRHERDWLYQPNRYALDHWMGDTMARIEDDFRRTFRDVPAGSSLGPIINENPKFNINRYKNTVECEVATGCGDFFRPEDIQLNVTGHLVDFCAKREEKSPEGNHYNFREVRRQFTVPEEADADRLQANLRPDGRLVLEAPLAKPLPEIGTSYSRPIPIEFKRS